MTWESWRRSVDLPAVKFQQFHSCWYNSTADRFARCGGLLILYQTAGAHRRSRRPLPRLLHLKTQRGFVFESFGPVSYRLALLKSSPSCTCMHQIASLIEWVVLELWTVVSELWTGIQRCELILNIVLHSFMMCLLTCGFSVGYTRSHISWGSCLMQT